MFSVPRNPEVSDVRPSSSSWMVAIESEFGSLKRALERRERQRCGLFGGAEEVECLPNTTPSHRMDLDVDAERNDEGSRLNTGGDGRDSPSGFVDSLTQPQGGGKKRGGSAPLLDLAAGEGRAYDCPVPLLASDTTTNDEIRRAHARHNRTIATHVEQWQRGSDKVNSLARAVAESHRELETVVAEAQLVHADPPAIESKSTVSNYFPIRETLRAIAALGSGIDDSDESPNDFRFLVEDANLTPREKVLLQRLRDTAAKLKASTQEMARLSSAWKEFQLQVDREQHEANEAHREEREEAAREWAETRQILTDDVAHWKHSSEQLLQELKDSKIASKAADEQHAKAVQELVAEHKAEIATWMNTVATSDREKHVLRDKLRAAEATVETLSAQSGNSTQRVVALEEHSRTLEVEVDRLTAALDSLTAQHQSASEELALLQAARPRVAQAALQVDTDALILDMKFTIESQRREVMQLRNENEVHRTKLLANAADIAALEVIRRQFASAQEDMTEERAARVAAENSVRRLVQRRLQLVASNFCLRAQLLRLQRPNGYGEKMTELTEENRWLFHKLQRIGAMHVVPGLVSRYPSEDMREGVDKDVLVHVSHTATQCQLVPAVALVRLSHTRGNRIEGVASSRFESGAVGDGCSVDEESDAADDDDVFGGGGAGEPSQSVAALRGRMSEYMSSSIGYRELQPHLAPFKALSHVATRMRQALLRDAASTLVEGRTSSPTGSPHEVAHHHDDNDGDTDGAANPIIHDKFPPSSSFKTRASAGETQRPSSAAAMKRGAVKATLRPASALSTVSSSSSATSRAIGSRRPGPNQNPAVGLNEPDSAATLSNNVDPAVSLAPQFCVLGHRDDPQQSALSHTPSQFFSMMRQQGLTGASGKRRQLELQQRLANQFIPDDPTENIGVRDSLPCSGPTADFEGNPQTQSRPHSSAAPKWLPTKSLPVATFPVRTMTPPVATALDAFMPNATQQPVGAWKARAK